ncbi:MAG: sialate O-acetylesterase [Flavobacteriaceae bacterium]
MISCNIEEKDSRTRFFPKVEVRADTISMAKNTWVFILAGQSNMAGRGFVEPQDTVPNERIFTINRKGVITLAKEPLHFYEPALTGLDCGLSFAKTLTQKIPDSISVLLLPTAVGGSSISQWLGDSIYRNVQLLTNFKEKVAIGKKHGVIKGILWHQGESDANPENITLYHKRLSKLVGAFRQIVADEKLPILIGELGPYSTNANWSKINAQIKSYASTDAEVTVIHTSDLKDKGDKVHFDSESQRSIGKRFANEFIKIQK